jgi:hypothetical protein
MSERGADDRRRKRWERIRSFHDIAVLVALGLFVALKIYQALYGVHR